MSIWDQYQARSDVRGTTRRNAHIIRELQSIDRHLPDNLSYCEVDLYDGMHSYNIESEVMDEYRQHRNVAIVNSDNLNEKMIFGMPGEDIECGSIVLWMDQHWLVTERDANTTLYTRCRLLQCNYLLKWIDDNNEIRTQWIAVEDGTKYLTGEYEDRNFIVTRGDSRIAITIGRNPYSAKLDRQMRFLIDDPLSEHMLAYALTKPLKFSGVYNDRGVFKFVLQEVVTTDDDNQELRIADYYKHFPRYPEAYVDEAIVGQAVIGSGNGGGTSIRPHDTDSFGRRNWL